MKSILATVTCGILILIGCAEREKLAPPRRNAMAIALRGSESFGSVLGRGLISLFNLEVPDPPRATAFTLSIQRHETQWWYRAQACKAELQYKLCLKQVVTNYFQENQPSLYHNWYWEVVSVWEGCQSASGAFNC
jgi:hypothetical protein